MWRGLMNIRVLRFHNLLDRVREAALLAALICLVAGGSTARAQTGASDQLVEVVVTAQKRTENVQDVPIAITAFTAQELQDRGVSDIHSLSNMTANVNMDAGSPFLGTS